MNAYRKRNTTFTHWLWKLNQKWRLLLTLTVLHGKIHIRKNRRTSVRVFVLHAMDLDDFLDLLTYTCPITGKRRCAVTGPLDDDEDMPACKKQKDTCHMYSVISWKFPSVSFSLCSSLLFPTSPPDIVWVLLASYWPKDDAGSGAGDLVGPLPMSSTSWSIDWGRLKACNIHNRTLPMQVPSPTCGKLLSHARKQAIAFREHIGIQVCVFKIGVTAAPEERFRDYLAKAFTSMWIICVNQNLGLIHMLEAALIQEFNTCNGCRNMPGTGGEGALNKKHHAPPPFFVYITGGRADQRKRVG